MKGFSDECTNKDFWSEKFDILIALEQDGKICRAEESLREQGASLTINRRRTQMEDVRENFKSTRNSLKNKY